MGNVMVGTYMSGAVGGVALVHTGQVTLAPATYIYMQIHMFKLIMLLHNIHNTNYKYSINDV